MPTQAICQSCGKIYTPSRYNEHHQKYCTREDCVKRRKQLRQKKWHNEKYQSDDAFRKAKQQSSREAMRRRREQEAATVAVSSDSNSRDPTHVIAGIVAQLADEDDPQALQEHLNVYAYRGRQLSQSIQCTGRSP
jgi:hypothetical protein